MTIATSEMVLSERELAIIKDLRRRAREGKLTAEETEILRGKRHDVMVHGLGNQEDPLAPRTHLPQSPIR